MKTTTKLFLVFLLLQQALFSQTSTCQKKVTVTHESGHSTSFYLDNNGAGLREHLTSEKAKADLEHHQKNSRPNWTSTALGTGGTVLLIWGLAKNERSNTLITTGIFLIALNVLIEKTRSYHNNLNLENIMKEQSRGFPKMKLGLTLPTSPKQGKGWATTPNGVGLQMAFNF